MENKHKFFLHGKFFKTGEEFWKEAEEYPKRQITEDSIKLELDFFCRNIEGNLLIQRPNMKNGELTDILHDMFISFINNLNQPVKPVKAQD